MTFHRCQDFAIPLLPIPLLLLPAEGMQEREADFLVPLGSPGIMTWAREEAISLTDLTGRSEGSSSATSPVPESPAAVPPPQWLTQRTHSLPVLTHTLTHWFSLPMLAVFLPHTNLFLLHTVTLSLLWYSFLTHTLITHILYYSSWHSFPTHTNTHTLFYHCSSNIFMNK